MEEQFIRDRLSKLREEKQVSERKMSLDLGHSTSYIRGITSGRSLPSMSEFLYICEYLGITPSEFFKEEKETTLTQQKAIDYIYTMTDEDIQLLIGFSQLKFLYPLKTLVFPAFSSPWFGPFPSFFPLREEMRETFFRPFLQPYPAVLRKFA